MQQSPSIIGPSACAQSLPPGRPQEYAPHVRGLAPMHTHSPPVTLFKAASTVSLLTLASRVTGLVRDVLMAAVFGVSAMTDAFYVAFRIPNLFRRVFGEGAFSQAFVPVLAAPRTETAMRAPRPGRPRGDLLIWTLVVVCALGVVGAPLLVWAMASGLKRNPHGFDAAVVMTRWMFPYIGFMSLVALAGRRPQHLARSRCRRPRRCC